MSLASLLEIEVQYGREIRTCRSLMAAADGIDELSQNPQRRFACAAIATGRSSQPARAISLEIDRHNDPWITTRSRKSISLCQWNVDPAEQVAAERPCVVSAMGADRKAHQCGVEDRRRNAGARDPRELFPIPVRVDPIRNQCAVWRRAQVPGTGERPASCRSDDGSFELGSLARALAGRHAEPRP